MEYKEMIFGMDNHLNCIEHLLFLYGNCKTSIPDESIFQLINEQTLYYLLFQNEWVSIKDGYKNVYAIACAVNKQIKCHL